MRTLRIQQPDSLDPLPLAYATLSSYHTQRSCEREWEARPDQPCVPANAISGLGSPQTFVCFAPANVHACQPCKRPGQTRPRHHPREPKHVPPQLGDSWVHPLSDPGQLCRTRQTFARNCSCGVPVKPCRYRLPLFSWLRCLRCLSSSLLSCPSPALATPSCFLPVFL